MMANNSIRVLSIVVLLLGLWGFSDATRKMVGTYVLRKGDFSVKVTNWGATIMSVVVPDKNGKLADVVLGYDTVGSYITGTSYFGALVGRVGNRIAGARFKINGKVYHLYRNDGNNTIHALIRWTQGFSAQIWDVKEKVLSGDSPYITFYYHSFDGDQDLDVYVTYKVSDHYELAVTIHAYPRNKPTLINLIQHSYWNLGGQSSGDILNNVVQIFASHITPANSEHIPTGEIASVDNTPFDFRYPMTVGSRITQEKGLYDHNYVVDSSPDEHGLRKVAIVQESKSGRVMELWSNQPGVQFYTSNHLDGNSTIGKGGVKYVQHAALCLETQNYPDAVHHPNFPNEIYGPGQTYEHLMVFKFSTKM